MKIAGITRRSITPALDRSSIEIIDQRHLPHALVFVHLRSLADAAQAIRDMQVRGAPLIGATAAFGVCFAMRADPSDAALERACADLLATRPTAVNLRWAVDEMRRTLAPAPAAARFAAAWDRARALCDEDVAINEAIGRHGLGLLRSIHAKKLAAAGRGEEPVLNVLTHCNAGWLATVDWGTALAPIYMAHDSGLPVHVWVDETRPRNQGALTAWELAAHGVPHTVIVDNAGGHLMQHGQVDVCLVGTDRVTAAGDVANKIGTYQKALAARDNGVPFYVGLPYPSIDWSIDEGLTGIPIEERGPSEVRAVSGVVGETKAGRPAAACAVTLYPDESAVANPAFDVTPARLVTGLITERGVCAASREGLVSLYPERGARPAGR